jgi:tetratricopeptide (TPR) repeat protein
LLSANDEAMTRRLLLQTFLFLFLRLMCHAAQPVFTGLWGTEFEIKTPAAAALHEQAWTEFFQGNILGAIASADAALEKVSLRSDSNHDQANLLATKAEAFLQLGDVRQARQVQQTIRTRLANGPATDVPTQIRLLLDEALLNKFESNLPLARKKLEEAAETAVANGLTNRPVYAAVLTAQANVHVVEGHLSDALRLIEASVVGH